MKIMRGIDRVDSQRLFPRVEVSIPRGLRIKVRGDVSVRCAGEVFHTEWWVPGTRCQKWWWKQRQ